MQTVGFADGLGQIVAWRVIQIEKFDHDVTLLGGLSHRQVLYSQMVGFWSGAIRFWNCCVAKLAIFEDSQVL